MKKNILLVALDLTGPSGSYKELFEALKEDGWWHYMKPMWLLYTEKTPEQLVDTLSPHIKGRGRIFVTQLKRPYQGILPRAAWEWIKKRIDE